MKCEIIDIKKIGPHESELFDLKISVKFTTKAFYFFGYEETTYIDVWRYNPVDGKEYMVDDAVYEFLPRETFLYETGNVLEYKYSIRINEVLRFQNEINKKIDFKKSIKDELRKLKIGERPGKY